MPIELRLFEQRDYRPKARPENTINPRFHESPSLGREGDSLRKPGIVAKGTMCAGKASFYDPDPKLRLVTVAKLLFDASKLVLDGFGIHGSAH